MRKGIRNIIFDFGGVIVNLDMQATIDGFMRMGVKAGNGGAMPDKYEQKGVLREHELGLITDEEFCERVLPGGDHARIREAWNAMLRCVPARRLRELRRLAKDYHLSLLSNTNEIHWEYAMKELFGKQGFTPDEVFEHQFLSQRMHVAKPHEEIFRKVLQESGYAPEETLFIDDSLINCAAFARLGVQTFCPQEPDDWMEKVATIGFFDGVHRGHRCLVDQVKEEAAKRGMSSMLITFDRHPREVLQDNYMPMLLSTLSEKMQLLQDTGADVCRVLPFNLELSQLSARDFMQQVLSDKLNVRVLVMGYDHRFGHGGGTFEEYREWGKEVGIEVLCAHELQETYVSSSECRRLLQEGRVEESATLLGHPYILMGKVVKGHQMGHELGFPTANLFPEQGKLLPQSGVYAVWVRLQDGKRYRGMLNIGQRPTLNNGEDTSIEVNILDFEGDLYGETIQLEFVKRLREERKFSSFHELQEQLAKDRKSVTQLLP